MMTSSVIHPSTLIDLERGIKVANKGISRKSSLNYLKGNAAEDVKRNANVLKNSPSCPSLSAELVESVMCDGQFRYVNEKAHEAAMWCGLISFVMMGVGLVIIGLYLALS